MISEAAADASREDGKSFGGGSLCVGRCASAVFPPPAAVLPHVPQSQRGLRWSRKKGSLDFQQSYLPSTPTFQCITEQGELSETGTPKIGLLGGFPGFVEDDVRKGPV